MATNEFSPGALLWQIFNLLVLLAVFVFLGVRVARAIRRTRPASSQAEQAASPKSLGECIRAHRQASKMTQEFVAESLGVSRQAVSKWESGASVPSTANLLALARLYGVEPQELLKGAGRGQRP